MTAPDLAGERIFAGFRCRLHRDRALKLVERLCNNWHWPTDKAMEQARFFAQGRGSTFFLIHGSLVPYNKTLGRSLF